MRNIWLNRGKFWLFNEIFCLVFLFDFVIFYKVLVNDRFVFVCGIEVYFLRFIVWDFIFC